MRNTYRIIWFRFWRRGFWCRRRCLRGWSSRGSLRSCSWNRRSFWSGGRGSRALRGRRVGSSGSAALWESRSAWKCWVRRGWATFARRGKMFSFRSLGRSLLGFRWCSCRMWYWLWCCRWFGQRVVDCSWEGIYICKVFLFTLLHSTVFMKAADFLAQQLLFLSSFSDNPKDKYSLPFSCCLPSSPFHLDTLYTNSHWGSWRTQKTTIYSNRLLQ